MPDVPEGALSAPIGSEASERRWLGREGLKGWTWEHLAGGSLYAVRPQTLRVPVAALVPEFEHRWRRVMYGQRNEPVTGWVES
jgi:hypothetical protein